MTREDWVEVIKRVIRVMPFPPSVIYSEIDPSRNEFLLASIDIERSRSRDPGEIVDFLCCVEEGWFFEDMAKKIELLREAKKIAEERLGRFSKKRRDAGRITSPQDGKH